MTDRAVLAAAAAAGLRPFASRITKSPVLVGFDGFVDSIIAVVEKRHDAVRYDAVPTIARFGEKIRAAAGQSSNYELVTTLRKLGGNGPIMANALAAAGLPVTYIGALGTPAIDPVFHELAQKAAVHSIVDPGYTDALEFDDGKIMLGKYAHLDAVNQSTLDAVMGREKYVAAVAAARLLAMVNWTMLPKLETIWTTLVDEVLPKVGGPRKLAFVDLADPEKRTANDIRGAAALCARMNRHADVVLGLNLKESTQVAGVLGIDVPADAEAAIEKTAAALRAKLDLFGVVIHPRKGAAAALKSADGQVTSATFAGPFVAKPKLSTGAGDNFNAGFCIGLLAGLSVEQCLCTGTATSGFYVRNAHSPSLTDLAAFCDHLPGPQA
jgi:sugar/nucleoside kinase (ribokinase family)